MFIISNHVVVSEVLSVIKNSKKGKTFRVLTGNTKIAFSVSILLHSSLVTFPFSDTFEKKKAPENSSVSSGFPTKSCPLPQASLRSRAERLSRWSPPACPLLEECQPCPATWNLSPPPALRAS